MKTKSASALAALLALGAGAALAAPATPAVNDYPTDARADYVFACMASNGESRAVLEECSCSIDHIASVVPYHDYVEAETLLSITQEGGPRVGGERGSTRVNNMVADVRRAQAESDMLCFTHR